MESQPTVWTILHDGDIICDSNGAVPAFMSKEGAEFFMDMHELTAPDFKLKELALTELKPTSSTPFRVN